MDKVFAGVKREYWEYRHIIVGLPLLLSVFSVVAFSLAGVAAIYYEEGSQQLFSSESEEIFSFEFIDFYISAAWFAGVYYLLSCLYGDRKDKSILFWKSLPVSETQNVVTKLLVACLGFVLVAIVIAWLTSMVLLLLFLALNSVGASVSLQQSGLEFSATRFFLWPLLGMVIGFVWAAPVFAYVLMISAIARRSPFLLLVVPFFMLSILERAIFKSKYLVSFFVEHLPFGVLNVLETSLSTGSFLHHYFFENGLSLGIGLAVAAVFIAVAIWFRNHKFEI